jgi:hypothetical protein
MIPAMIVLIGFGAETRVSMTDRIRSLRITRPFREQHLRERKSKFNFTNNLIGRKLMPMNCIGNVVRDSEAIGVIESRDGIVGFL